MLAREHMLSEGLVKELMQRDTERNKEWKRGSERPFWSSPWLKTEASSRSRSRGRPFWRISGRRAPGWYS